MASCTFFGHRDYNGSKEELIFVLRDLIRNNNVDVFYVGNQGNFDSVILQVLRILQKEFTHIRYSVVLAYHPSINRYSEFISSEETLLPEEIEKVPIRFAIAKRNEWMISKSDYAVVFVKHPTGGASKYKEFAERKGLTVINLCKHN